MFLRHVQFSIGFFIKSYSVFKSIKGSCFCPFDQSGNINNICLIDETRFLALLVMTRFQNWIQNHDDELPEAESIDIAYKKLYDLPQRKRKDPLIRIVEKWKLWRSIACWYYYRYHAM